jgi:polyhydroxyalkanoate synthesis regulator phasin
MQDAWRAYLELALGVTEASRRKAEQVARDLVGRGGATAAQVQGFVDELMSASRANREGLVKLVRYEVERALGAVGLATSDEVAELTTRVRKLERDLRDAQASATAPGGTAAPPEATAVAKTTRKAATSSAAKAPTKAKSAGRKTPASQAPTKVPVKKAARKQPAKKATGTPRGRA